MPEHVDRDSAARIPIAADAQPHRLHLVEQPLADADGAVLVKPGMVAEAAQEQFERLGFDDRLAGNIVDDEVREVGLAGDGAQRGELGRREPDEIRATRPRVRNIIEHGLFWRGGEGAVLAEMQWVLEIGRASCRERVF